MTDESIHILLPDEVDCDRARKKVWSSCLGQEAFPVGQVTLHPNLPDGQGARQVLQQLNKKNTKLRLNHGKQNLGGACLEP